MIGFGHEPVDCLATNHLVWRVVADEQIRSFIPAFESLDTVIRGDIGISHSLRWSSHTHILTGKINACHIFGINSPGNAGKDTGQEGNRIRIPIRVLDDLPHRQIDLIVGKLHYPIFKEKWTWMCRHIFGRRGKRASLAVLKEIGTGSRRGLDQLGIYIE